jgi:hypothetical protein
MVNAFICERCEKQSKRKVDKFNGGRKNISDFVINYIVKLRCNGSSL